ncbi:40S ribosomal protein S2 [Microtus ochrogaster]|uniref:40S ribosomal protein S2 n=1 Tax=Microtus ochrogaster TaxID=79684 RepID=A0A8J6GDU6_MICOH|nr:40S ribosomal protein S2 [Microtus ochrogaster]
MASSVEASAAVLGAMVVVQVVGLLGDKAEGKEWIPITKLGCLVKIMKMYLFSLFVKESEITGFFLSASLKDILKDPASVEADLAGYPKHRVCHYRELK